jgi:hypothetical protein
MMTISYKGGNDKGAMRYAYRAYETTGELYFVGFATRVAIALDNFEDTDCYGSELVKDEANFETYCSEIDKKEGYEQGTYEIFVLGKIAVAKYELGKKAEAEEYAFNTLDGKFPENNAVVALWVTAVQNGDFETANAIVEKLRVLAVDNETDRAYLLAFLESL